MSTLLRRFALLIGDALILYLSLMAALFLRNLGVASVPFLLQHVVTFSFLFPCWLIVFYILGLYELGDIIDPLTVIGNILLAGLINLPLSIGLFYLFPGALKIAPKTHLLQTVVFAHAGAALWRRLVTHVLFPKFARRRVAFLGDSPLLKTIMADLGRFTFLGYVPVESSGLLQKPGPASIDEYWRESEATATRLKDLVDLIVVDAAQMESPAMGGPAMLSGAIMEEIPIRTHLDFYEEIYRKIPPDYAAKPNWLLSHVLKEKDPIDSAVKRAFDWSCSLLGLLVLSPLLLLIALVSMAADGALPIYRQKRIGYHGRDFLIWKFRTMVAGAESKGPLYHPEKRDGRVTRFGAFLRRFRLDELPQLWNVLKGEMSLVGPRPEWSDEARVLERTVAHYHLRHLVKPGITGWAQVNFRATNSPADSVEKLHFDLFYVKNTSLALDVLILLKTVKRIFQRENRFHRADENENAPRPARP